MIEVLIATSNNRVHGLLSALPNPATGVKYLIIHQVYDGERHPAESTRTDVRLITVEEKGLSKSRNRALKLSEGDICLVMDDDVRFKPDFAEQIQHAFELYPETDVCTFCVDTPEGKPFKPYRKEGFVHTARTVGSVSSIEIAFRRQRILDAGIQFDTAFGLGADYPTGEEFIFLTDVLKAGLRARFVPKVLVVHPAESSGRLFNERLVMSKGALFARVYGWKYPLVNIYFTLRKRGEYRAVMSPLTFLKHIFAGSRAYLNNGR